MPASNSYPSPLATVDAVVFTLEDDQLKLLLHRRPNDPYADRWALPGGVIHVDEDRDAEDAIRRILTDKAGTSGFYLEQLGTYSGRERDPRGWSLSIAYMALVPREKLDFLDDGTISLENVSSLPRLAFDHDRIVGDAVSRLRGKGSYSSLPASFLDAEFTLGDLQKAYEAVLGAPLDHSSFRRKVLALDLLEETGAYRRGARMRPAKLFRLKSGISTFNRTLGAPEG